MIFPWKTLSLLVVIALGVAVLALFLAVVTAARRRPGTPQGALPIQLDDALRGILEGHARTLQRLDAAVRRLSAEDARLGERLSGAVQRVALIRYDAFEDVGGRLSFSCALLDERGDGVVVTSMFAVAVRVVVFPSVGFAGFAASDTDKQLKVMTLEVAWTRLVSKRAIRAWYVGYPLQVNVVVQVVPDPQLVMDVPGLDVSKISM